MKALFQPSRVRPTQLTGRPDWINNCIMKMMQSVDGEEWKTRKKNKENCIELVLCVLCAGLGNKAPRFNCIVLLRRPQCTSNVCIDRLTWTVKVYPPQYGGGPDSQGRDRVSITKCICASITPPSITAERPMLDNTGGCGASPNHSSSMSRD